MDSQRPKLPTAEPTPDSPASTQTSPVSEPDGDSGRAGIRTPSAPFPPAKNGNKKLVAAIIAVVVVIAGLIFLFLSPWSPLASSSVPTGPQLMLGSNKYIHACNVFNKELVAKELDVKVDANKENATENFSYDPANTKDKTLDVAKATESKSILSRCNLKLDRIQEGSGAAQKNSFVNASAIIEQFPSDSKASDAFKLDKRRAGSTAKALPSFSDSFYTLPKSATADRAPTLQPRVLHKNTIIAVNFPLDDQDKTNGQQDINKLDRIMKDITTRIDNHEGDKPKDFSGVNQIGGNQFTDACVKINYKKVTEAMGNNTQFDIKSINGNQAYAPDNENGKTPDELVSACTFYFRTQYEADQAKNFVPSDSDAMLSYADKYPHYISLQLAVTENKDKAKQFLTSARKEAEESAKKKNSDTQKSTVEDVKGLGDGAIKVTLKEQFQPDETDGSASESNGQLYYIIKGANIYILAATYIKQDRPIKSEAKSLSPDQVKKIYKEMTLATKRAN